MWIALQDKVLVDISKIAWIELTKCSRTDEYLIEFHTSMEKESYVLIYKTQAEAEAEFERLRFLLSKTNIPPIPIC